MINRNAKRVPVVQWNKGKITELFNLNEMTLINVVAEVSSSKDIRADDFESS
jgi:hypothetical protein